MPRIRAFVYNSTFFLVCLLAFLLIFESQLSIPDWVQIGGRMHPLLLHFPITVLILYGVWVIFVPRNSETNIFQALANDVLLLGAFTATLTALMGLILSQESGYDADALFWHKWTGVATSFISFGWYSFREKLSVHHIFSKALSAVTVVVLLVAGHLGANITHGEEFLLAPLQSAQKEEMVALEEALVYEHVVRPILEEKCMSCHNPKKAKGELIMTTAELFAKGGKNGVPWDTTEADLGLLLRRAHLPIDDKKHMPPRGKIQLTDEEVLVLESWIRKGADFKVKVQEYPQIDPLYQFAVRKLDSGQDAEVYDFAAADETTLLKLNTNYRVITPLSETSPALAVSFYSAAAFKNSDLDELTPIKDQIVSLDLSKMPVKDEALKTIAQFPNLRKLLLNFTDISGATLGDLTTLPNLKYLSLTGTPVKADQVSQLKKLPSLQTIYAWNTGIAPRDFEKLKTQMKGIDLIAGYRSDTVVLKLNPPQIENKDQILSNALPVRIKHQIAGTTIRYTLDDSEPDSIASPVYKNGILIDRNVLLKARAFKPGWYGSEVISRRFYRNTYKIDSVQLLTTPAPQYNGQQGKVLRDGIKSNGDFKNGKWVGFREEPLTALLLFKKPVPAKTISLSMLHNIGASIFPPVRIEVWGGTQENNLKLLGKIIPDRVTEQTPKNEEKLYEIPVATEPLRYLKIVAVPLSRLPAWHTSKGEPAWVFMDEVLIN